MQLRRAKFAGSLAVLVTALWMLAPLSAFAAQSHKSSSSKSKSSSKKTVHRRTSSRHHRARRSSYRARVARLKLEPERVQEIQQALIREGYLSQEPTGKWDDATRSAMKDYQTKNGFNATGLPEAKTLMKLGLGPHPLPADADPNIIGQARINAPASPQSNPQDQ